MKIPRGSLIVPLHLYSDVLSSGSVPAVWRPDKGGALKYPVRNASLLRYLRSLKAGQWQKVIKPGDIGEVHQIEHASGAVAGVKFFLRQKESGS
jgi:hypothetical protein